MTDDDLLPGRPRPPGPPRPPAPGRAAEAIKRGNRDPSMLRMLRSAREMLPGDPNLGDENAILGERPSDVLARYLSERSSQTGSTLSRELGLTAVQLFQAFTERTGAGAAEVSATILFTDLVGFSDWVLEAGDDAALELLRAVAAVVEPTIKKHKGTIVKNLGDGHMAVFGDPRAGVDAALQVQRRLRKVEVQGHRPRLREGLHVGRPQRVRDDYLGTDVNIAARVGAAAGAGEVLISDAVLTAIDPTGLTIKRKRGFRAKGVPSDTQVYSVVADER
jgi:adenylate cyclase